LTKIVTMEASPESRTQTKSVRTRQRILDAAAAVLRERGYAATTLSDIATAAGTKAGSLYYHFDSKDDLVEQVMWSAIEQAHSQVRAAIAALGEDADSVEKIRVAIRSHLDIVIDQGAYAPATLRILGEIPDHIRQRQFAVQGEYGRFWRDLLDGAQAVGEIRADVDTHVVRMLLIGAINWIQEWPPALRANRAVVDETIEKVFLEGLVRRGATDAVAAAGRVLPPTG
jgi:AcrR family transcriptional regulator